MRFVVVSALALAGAAPTPVPAPGPAPGPVTAPAPGDPRSAEYPEWKTVNPGEHTAYNQRASLFQRGKLVYEQNCVGCHGEKGDGKGPAARRLLTQPRDFTSGIFKFRSTDSSSLPLESDLYRTITRGLPRVSMPAFPLMPEQDKLAVIEYMKSFYPRWDRRAGQRVVVPAPRAPEDLLRPQRAKRGRVVYVTMQCGSCHGNDGARGDAVFVDAWGKPQKAFDFTAGRLKGGDDPEDIYRTFHAGLISVMPAFPGETLVAVTREGFMAQQERLAPGELEKLQPALAEFPASGAELAAMTPATAAEVGERNSWDLVAYVISLRRSTSTAAAVLGSQR